ncbi:MAG TPA: hypothetical protein VF533_22090 [Solirubrobacteraceae bacterium]
MSCLLVAYPAHAQSNTGGASSNSDKPDKREAPPESAPGGAQPGQPAAEPAPAGQPAPGAPGPTVPGVKAKLLPDGTAAAPELAPPQIQQMIWAVNASLLDKPYRYGGGHRSFTDSGYDCSGTVSFALNSGGLLKSPLDSSSFMSWGEKGKGQWITVRTNPGHAFVVIAGLRLDTSSAYVSRARAARKKGKRARIAAKALERGPRWRPNLRPASGFTARHPAGF